MTAVVPLPQRKGGGFFGSICNRRDLFPHSSLGWLAGWLAVVSCGWLLIAAGPLRPFGGHIPHPASREPPPPVLVAEDRGQTGSTGKAPRR